ncbi:ABC transporter permease [Parasphingorhabdus halotolerans]|uniref:ABC transporter permease n=1 Tax=Parasphingorhabdus halotolerans TaxID=2725558 RepID=A0A6H2DK74_9SPHN|nr:ABC transporter permease [Parasphingorhabdus halotolerans]QJB68744.1 ABC transporter permease [Parasphingorhabdus halotolerans]
MTIPSDFSEETTEDGVATLRFSGNLSIASLEDLPERLRAYDGGATQLDISETGYVDTVGAWLIYRTARDMGAEITGADDEAQRLIAAVSAADEPAEVRPVLPNPVIRVLGEIGEATTTAFKTMAGLVGFFGAVTAASFSLLRHPGRIRWHAVIQRFDVVGVRALGIVGLMSFLIGLVIAQQGAVQLRQFGAEVFTVNLVGRLTLRELGVLMTAIMVAGRSGSAFAAQIGTMKLTEEIDAMRTIGVSPVEALVIPRMMAAVLMLPLLGFYASVVAIIGGGLLSWVALDIPPATFFARIREVVPITDVYIGLVKAPVFGAIIALSGCYQGMQVEGNAEEVGKRTTAAVVQAIFLVIVLDAFFAVFFSWIGWN